MAGSEPEEDEDVLDSAQQTRRPGDTALRQQRIEAWHPYLDPWWVVGSFLALAAILIPVGFKLQSMSDEIVELKIQYDAYDDPAPPCGIDVANANQTCSISFPPTPRDMDPPILIYYELDNFHQNHRDYVKSRDSEQLLGQVGSEQSKLQAELCDPLNKVGEIRLNPCGLIANTLFNDVIQLVNEEYTMVEEGIAWQSDLEYMFKQPDGFESGVCPGECDASCCEGEDWSCELPYNHTDGECYRFFYPEDDTTQYLYETYPMVVSPLEGVTNEHFAVWMRVATLPKFIKLYGYIETPIPAGTILTFQIDANFEVKSFEGRKSLMITTNNRFGGKNVYVGPMFYGIGFFCLGAALFFGLKQALRPRKIADESYLHYKQE